MISCTEETDISRSGGINTGEEITFTIKVPGSPTVSTRSIDQGETADKAVLTIDLLLFDHTSKMYVGKVLSDKIVDISTTEKTVTISIPKGRFDIVILANARSIVNAAIVPANDPLTKNKSEICDLLTKTLPNKTDAPLTGIWNAQPTSSGYEHFPMWSEKTDFSIPTNGVSLSVSLVRMLAKVNVTFKSKEVSEKLAIESIMVCNFNKTGYLTSDRWNFSIADGVAQSQNNIDEYASRSLGVSNGLVYVNTSEYPNIIRKESEIQLCKDEIFLFESQKPTDQTSEQQRMEATCLIIKGKYDGGSEDRYYRIDFATREGSAINYLSLLRNHIYSIVINSVNTAGHPSAEIAYQSFAADMNIGISSWSDGGVGETAFDGQYTLSITPNELELFRDLSTENSFIIHTDYPVAPSIPSVDYTEVDNADWITSISTVTRKPLLDKENGKKRAYQVTFDCLENKTGNIRLAKINITAGNHLNLKVSVTQTASSTLTLRVDDITDNPIENITELTFPSGLYTSDPITPKSIRISWTPFGNNNECKSIATVIGNDFNFGTGFALPTGNTSLTNMTGTIEYSGIIPPAFTQAEVAKPNEFFEKTRLYSYTTSNGVKNISKTLMLSQVHYNAVADLADFYLMDGKEHSLKIRSNSGWKITLNGKDGSDGDPKGVVSKFSVVQGGYDTKDGQVVKFSLKNDIAMRSAIGEAEIKFTITCTDPNRKFDPVEIVLYTRSGVIREVSNSYIVAPGSSPIFIPVKRANGMLLDNSSTADENWFLGTQITPTGENAKFGIKLLWTDGKGTNGKGLASDGVIKEIRTAGSGNSGYLIVIPGTKHGNALVAITRTPGVNGAEGTGDILWSFHIWVTDYYPYDASGNAQGSVTNIPEKYWMNRNLGAKTNTLGTADTYGLFYQFGRKDPFPGGATLTGTGNAAGKPMYNSAGDLIVINAIGVYDAEGTVRNPLTLVNAWYGTLGSTAASISSAPWNYNSKKTLYDPCPKGYRVPIFSNTPSTDTSRDWGNVDLTVTGDGISTPQWTSYGISWDDKGGYYPAAGYLGPLGTYWEQGLIGYAWSATPHTSSTGNAYSLRFSSGNMLHANSAFKNSAGAVRCVAE